MLSSSLSDCQSLTLTVVNVVIVVIVVIVVTVVIVFILVIVVIVVNRFFFMKTAVTRERKVEKSIPRWEMKGLSVGYDRAVDQDWGRGKL